MNIVDVGIVFLLLFGALRGFKRGFTRQLINSLGFIIIVFLAFQLKTPVSLLLFKILPFFKFGGVLKGVVVFNILLYEILAFLIVLVLLSLLLKVLLLASRVFETILNMTIILGIPSKILGAIVGVVEYYVIIFVLLYVASLPVFDTSIFDESQNKNLILNNTPILSNFADKSLGVLDDFTVLKEKFTTEKDVNQFNLEALDLLLAKQIVKVETIDSLIGNNKLRLDNVEIVLKKYR